jgi:hypothetical protein
MLRFKSQLLLKCSSKSLSPSRALSLSLSNVQTPISGISSVKRYSTSASDILNNNSNTASTTTDTPPATLRGKPLLSPKTAQTVIPSVYLSPSSSSYKNNNNKSLPLAAESPNPVIVLRNALSLKLGISAYDALSECLDRAKSNDKERGSSFINQLSDSDLQKTLQLWESRKQEVNFLFRNNCELLFSLFEGLEQERRPLFDMSVYRQLIVLVCSSGNIE